MRKGRRDSMFSAIKMKKPMKGGAGRHSLVILQEEIKGERFVKVNSSCMSVCLLVMKHCADM